MGDRRANVVGLATDKEAYESLSVADGPNGEDTGRSPRRHRW